MPRPARLLATALEDRRTPAGVLDPTFGTAGQLRLSFPDGTFIPAAVAVLPDGATVVGGTFSATSAADGGADFAAVRLTPAGQLDTGFGVNGRATVGFDPAGGTTRDAVTAVAVDRAGRVVLVGAVDTVLDNPPGVTAVNGPGVVRLRADGSLDAGFGGGGKLLAGGPGPGVLSAVTAVAVDGAGRVVLAGNTIESFAQSARPFTNSRGVAAVLRLGTDGQPDPTFGAGNLVRVRTGPDAPSAANAVAVQADGRIVVGGSFRANDDAGDGFGAARLLPDGRPDLAFSGDGVSTLPAALVGDAAQAVAVRSDGTVALLGQLFTTPRALTYVPVVARLRADGSPDGTFAGDGVATAPDAGPFDSRPAVNFTRDGGLTLAAAGQVTRFTAAGATTDASPPLARPFGATAAAVLPNGQVVLAYPAGDGSDVVQAVRVAGQGLPPAEPVAVGGSPDGFAQWAGVGGELGDRVQVFPNFPGTVRTASADVTGDGVADLVAGPGPGGGPNVVVVNGATGQPVADFLAFEGSFTGGLYVAAADLNADGRAEVVVTADQGGGPVVAVFDGAGLAAGAGADAQLVRFFGIEDPAFRGGARPALGDVSGDGVPDLLVAAGFGGGPRVAVFDGRDLPGGRRKLVGDFFVFEPTLRNGVFVAAGDLTADGTAEVVVGGGPGGGPRVFALDGRSLLAGTQTPVANFFAGDERSRGGVRVAVRDGQLVTGSGSDEAATVRVFPAAAARSGGPAARTIQPFGGAVLPDGVFVG